MRKIPIALAALFFLPIASHAQSKLQLYREKLAEIMPYELSGDALVAGQMWLDAAKSPALNGIFDIYLKAIQDFAAGGAKERALAALDECNGRYSNRCEFMRKSANNFTMTSMKDEATKDMAEMSARNQRLAAVTRPPAEVAQAEEPEVFAPPVYAPPTGTNPSGPACATGQREMVQAQGNCARGDATSCARVPQLMNAMRSINCSVPVFAGGRATQSSDPADLNTSPSLPSGNRGIPVDCVQQERRANGLFYLRNDCASAVNYSFCVENTSSPYACGSSMDSQGSAQILSGKSSYPGDSGHIIFSACLVSSGAIPRLEGGRRRCQ